jgi:hypothetical protein
MSMPILANGKNFTSVIAVKPGGAGAVIAPLQRWIPQKSREA